MKTIILILLLAGFSLGSSDNPAATPDKMATASKKIPWYKKLEVVRFVELVLEDEAQDTATPRLGSNTRSSRTRPTTNAWNFYPAWSMKKTKRAVGV